MHSSYKNWPESKHQKEFVAWFKRVHYLYANLIIKIHNEGSRTVIANVELIRQGLCTGIPDLFIAVPRGTYHGLFIEMKKIGGKPTNPQKDKIESLQHMGYAAYIAYGHREAEKIATNYFEIEVCDGNGK